MMHIHIYRVGGQLTRRRRTSGNAKTFTYPKISPFFHDRAANRPSSQRSTSPVNCERPRYQIPCSTILHMLIHHADRIPIDPLSIY